MRNSEVGVLCFFTLGAAFGFSSAVLKQATGDSPDQFTGNITASFLMSICGNATRILANPTAYPSEKIILSIAVISYTWGLACDADADPELAVYVKLITTGCVGLWNAVQMIRLRAESPLLDDATRVSMASQRLMALLGFCCYCSGAGLGFGAPSIGLLAKAPYASLEPYITFAFLMSHWGNLIRPDLRDGAPSLEKSFILIAVLSYCVGLYGDFSSSNDMKNIGTSTKLIAAGFVGLWNSARTWRLNPEMHDVFSLCRAVNAPVQPDECSPEVRQVSEHNPMHSSYAAWSMFGGSAAVPNYGSLTEDRDACIEMGNTVAHSI